MTGKGGDKEGETEREGGKTGKGERQGRGRGEGETGEKDRGGGQTGEGRRGDRGDRQGGGTEREGEQRGRGDRQEGGTYIGVGTPCRSLVVASFAVGQQVLSFDKGTSSLFGGSSLSSGVGIVVRGWGVIVQVGARSASRLWVVLGRRLWAPLLLMWAAVLWWWGLLHR